MVAMSKSLKTWNSQSCPKSRKFHSQQWGFFISHLQPLFFATKRSSLKSFTTLRIWIFQKIPCFYMAFLEVCTGWFLFQSGTVLVKWYLKVKAVCVKTQNMCFILFYFIFSEQRAFHHQWTQCPELNTYWREFVHALKKKLHTSISNVQPFRSICHWVQKL